jgi:hypothetical protein
MNTILLDYGDKQVRITFVYSIRLSDGIFWTGKDDNANYWIGFLDDNNQFTTIFLRPEYALLVVRQLQDYIRSHTSNTVDQTLRYLYQEWFFD